MNFTNTFTTTPQKILKCEKKIRESELHTTLLFTTNIDPAPITRKVSEISENKLSDEDNFPESEEDIELNDDNALSTDYQMTMTVMMKTMDILLNNFLL